MLWDKLQVKSLLKGKKLRSIGTQTKEVDEKKEEIEKSSFDALTDKISILMGKLDEERTTM